MNKMKKLLSVLLAVVMILSSMTVMASAAKTAYKTTDELTTLAAYSPYGQVTRLSTEERASMILDFLDSVLPSLNINMGTVVDVLGLKVTINFTSVDNMLASIDSFADTFSNLLFSIAKAIINLGILEDLTFSSWNTGMTRDGTAQLTIFEEIFALLDSNGSGDGNVIQSVFSNGLDLGIISLGDMSAIEEVILDLPGMVKGMVFPMLERWDDTLTEVKWLDTNGKGDGNVESTINTFVKNLFNNDMSITTIKYDVNGNMTSEHTNWESVATGTAAPGTPSDNSPRCYYQFTGTTPGSVMTVYHIVDEKEAEALAEDKDETNNVAVYNYFQEKQTFVMTQEVEGSETYVWRATDEWGNTWSLKWYNDNSPLLPGFSGDSIDLTTQSLTDLLYMFVPHVFGNMAPVVLNGSIKKVLAEFLGAKFTYVGQGGPEADDAVKALADYSASTFFSEEQGDYLWEWSNYAVINGNHYYRFEDQIFKSDLSQKNNYFDIINWDYEIGEDFLDEFIPTSPSPTSTILMNLNSFIIKVAEEALLPSASTVDTISGFEAEWTRPALTAGGNENLVENVKAIAQAVIGLAPQHVFGSNYATNERCYVELMLSDDNDTVLTGIAAHLVNMIMPSVSLPGKSDLVNSNAKVGAILAAVVREFAAYLVPEYNYDNLIYVDYGTSTSDKIKTFVDPEAAGLLTSGQTASGYWLDVIMTIGLDVGYEYLRAFSDIGEDSGDVVTGGVLNVGYMHAGGTYAAGTTQAQLNAQWEGMVDYIIDWALVTDKEWAWKMSNIVDTGSLTIDLATAQDPWQKLDYILNYILPVDEILNVTATDCETELEQLLRYNFILAIVDLRWEDLAEMLQVPTGFVRNANVLDSLATVLKNLVNSLFKKIGVHPDDVASTGYTFELIPSVITDFDSLAVQANLSTLIQNLVSHLYDAYCAGLCDTLFPFLNFLLGWKTDPQRLAAPEMWTSFRDGDDYAFQWNPNTSAVTAAGEAMNSTYIYLMNNSSGMLETHRNSSVTDHAYEINIKSVTSDATLNTLTFTYDSVVSPWEQIAIEVGGTYQGEEAVTVTIAYDYVGKDGVAVGGTQYTSISFFISNQYEDANIDGRYDGDDDTDYAGIDQYKKYQWTEDIYTTVTTFEPQIFGTKSSLGQTASKSFSSITAPDHEKDCDGNITTNHDMAYLAPDKFDYITDQTEAGWESPIQAESSQTSANGKLYKAASGVTADTEFEYGTYDMGKVAVKYGSDSKIWDIVYIYYNDYDVYDLYLENKDNGYTADMVDDASIYEAYNTAWKNIVKYATYPMMTEANGNSATDYVKTIQPYIPAAIEAFETAKEAFDEAAAEASAIGSDAGMPSHAQSLEAQLKLDETDEETGVKEVNFQDYEFYEYFNYADLRTVGRNVIKDYYAPEVMDTYYILGSGIREAELNNVIAAESNPFIAAGITASRLENDAAAIAASQEVVDNWTMPTYSVLNLEDLTARIRYYKQFLIMEAEVDQDGDGTNAPAHRYFLNKEIAFVTAQELVEDDYTADSWAKYAEALADAQTVAAGSDAYSAYNSRNYDAKYNLMVAYKNLLAKEDSLIEAGGTADLMANRDIADEIFASLEAGDGAWVVKEGVDAETAYAALITALGYYYVGEDGNTWNLYADSALEYIDNDRPNNQNNQAKVNTANNNLVAAIENFEQAVTEPNTIMLKEDAPFEAIIDLDNNLGGEYNGTIYGFDTLGWNEDWTADGAIADFITTAYGDDYLEVIVPEDAGVETTGTVINVLDDEGNVVESYVYIYFGDMDMDGNVGASDSGMAFDYESLYEGIDSLDVFMAGDLDADTMPGASDAGVMYDWEALYEGMPYQVDVASGVYGIVYEIY